ncbi:MAG: ADP-ribosylglycohydrolase family protein [Armatimonadetes bacterium]|nr:ADP-ribosylglycohydrolase family protein [Armatimonadota bacterium]MDE2206315.1 ADP-ribosylglycohydrolase family protein [Armatimonadota bacterium]
MQFPADYAERVYAGVLGKVIGVYAGRPFEGWSFADITARFGEINRYVNEDFGARLVVSDDDISGTLAFPRVLDDTGAGLAISSRQIGCGWLNTIIEERTILWWGGMGVSTEHTAYLRLKSGMPAPESGSAAVNGTVVSEQIGAQIFIDGWGMLAPGAPRLAADLAGRAARVSHDGEAVFAAQFVAAMVAAAFTERDIQRLLDIGLSVIPGDSLVAAVVGDLKRWRAEETDWRSTRERVDELYGYHRYGGGCHVIPNFALIVLALLYGDGSFDRSLMIVNTCGWDTDCNSGNVGCLLAVRGGLAAFDGGYDWRGPVRDRIYIPTSDGGGCVTDAVQEAWRIVRRAYALHGLADQGPPAGPRYRFGFPGAVQGFTAEGAKAGAAAVQGSHALRISGSCAGPDHWLYAHTATFIPPEDFDMPGYQLVASPSLYPGQTVQAHVTADPANNEGVRVRLQAAYYDENDAMSTIYGPVAPLDPGRSASLEWRIPPETSGPVARIGVAMQTAPGSTADVLLRSLDWDGTPECSFVRGTSSASAHAWVLGATALQQWPRDEWIRLVENGSRPGLLIQGARVWGGVALRAEVNIHMAARAGIAVRVQGMTRFYALWRASEGHIELVRVLDGETQVLAASPFAWPLDRTVPLSLTVSGARLTGTAGADTILSAEDHMLDGGAIALLCSEGTVGFRNVAVAPPGELNR